MSRTSLDGIHLRSAASVLATLSIFLLPGVPVASDSGTEVDAGATKAALHAVRGIGGLDVDVRTRSEAGRVFCALWPEADGFPIDRAAASHEDMSGDLEDRRPTLRFESVAVGTYALACFHDENGNGRLDTNFVGIPSEGTGASNGARGFMGPPSFRDARFELTELGPGRLTVEIEY